MDFEEVERNLEIEMLLDPLTRTQRDALYGFDGGPLNLSKLKQPTFVHYTSAEAAMSIIENNYMWMRNAKTMDDWSEMLHGYKILQNYFSSACKRDRFLSACDHVTEKAGESIFGTFDRWWDHINLNTFIASVSEHISSEDKHGRLSMWRAFGGTATRIALKFKPPPISSAASRLNIQLSPVVYKNESQVHAALDRVVDNIENRKQLFSALGPQDFCSRVVAAFISMVVGLKHEAFSEEREWRVIYHPILKPSAFIKKKVVSIRGVPQLVHLLPIGSENDPDLQELNLKNMLDGIIVGPTAYPWNVYEALVECLRAADVKNAENKVVTSGIPLR